MSGKGVIEMLAEKTPLRGYRKMALSIRDKVVTSRFPSAIPVPS
jgi:hypothetical protein